MAELSTRQQQLMQGFRLPDERVQDTSAPTLNARQQQLMQGFTVDNVLVKPAERQTAEMQLQGLLVRQSKGEQGLQDQITLLRQKTGIPDEDPGKQFIPQQEAGLGTKTGVAGRKLLTGEDKVTPESQALPTIYDASFMQDYPEADKAKFAALHMFTPNEKEQAKIINEQFPDMQTSFDDAGNLMITDNKGVKAQSNVPGFSTADVMQTLGGAGLFS